MAKLAEKTWVLVADGEKALFLENETDHENPFLRVVRKSEQENPGNLDRGTDRPGRMSDGGPGQKSAVEETDWHALAKDRFATDLADLLYGHAQRKRFEQIILVAAPSVLGALRDQLHQLVLGRVVAEIPKTLTNHPLTKIEKIVKAELA